MSRQIFHAIFTEGVRVTKNVLRQCASDIGLDGPALVAALDTPETSSRHEAVLDRAIADGAFGVPSFVVGGQVFWGNDRLVLVEHALARST